MFLARRRFTISYLYNNLLRFFETFEKKSFIACLGGLGLETFHLFLVFL